MNNILPDINTILSEVGINNISEMYLYGVLVTDIRLVCVEYCLCTIYKYLIYYVLTIIVKLKSKMSSM
jgi:hypothetical protein